MTPALVCRSCGHPVVQGSRFCGNCAAEVRTPAPISSGSGEYPVVIDSARAADILLDALRRATLGEYEIKGELGRGGMAVVYLAHDIRLGRKVALKALAPELQLVDGMAQRFLREAQTAAALEHPNIISIYAHREAVDVTFFTMRYVAGIPLSSLAKAAGALPIPLVRMLMWDVGGALAFAHRHGVLHRDVKPGNVMISREGGVYVTDFGIAKQTEGQPGLTVTGQLLGTPGYMSPEQCRGQDVSPASDQYSLGAMLFELVAGRPPFVGANVMDVMAQQMTEAVPSLRSFRGDCPPQLAATIERMLEKDPRNRFPSLGEALAAGGATPILPGDALRDQLAQWVGEPQHVRAFAVTPVSPTPLLSDIIARKDTTLLHRRPSPEGERSTPRPATPVPAPPRVPTPAVAKTVVEQPSDSGKGGMRGWVLTAAVALVLVAATWLVSSRRDDGNSAVVGDSDRSVADSVRVVRDTTKPKSDSSRAVADTAKAKPPAVVADTPKVRERKEKPPAKDATRDSARVPPPPPPPPAAPGVLMLRVVPYARIYVDGKLVTEDELLVRTLSAGEHRVRFEKDGFEDGDTVVTIGAGDTLKVRFRMTRRGQ